MLRTGLSREAFPVPGVGGERRCPWQPGGPAKSDPSLWKGCYFRGGGSVGLVQSGGLPVPGLLHVTMVRTRPVIKVISSL